MDKALEVLKHNQVLEQRLILIYGILAKQAHKSIISQQVCILLKLI
jgi:hypothetical protein